MIHAVVFKDQEDRIRGFELCGHAEYAQPGQDVVCAAVSMLAINTANSIECLTEDQFSMTEDDEKGEIPYQIEGIPSKEAQLLLASLNLGLKEMADDENYAEYIDLTVQEV